MRLIDKRPKVSRRTLLKTGAAVVAVVPAIGAAQAAPMAVSPESFATLVKMARDVYPHEKVGDMHYAKVIEGLDAGAKDDAAKKAMLEDGVAALNTAAGGNYAGMADEAGRVAILKNMETTPFFQAIRGSLVTGLYNNQEVWPIFGYEGSSADKGGYIDRGFADIDWLDKA
jgi:hypothetical protein